MPRPTGSRWTSNRGSQGKRDTHQVPCHGLPEHEDQSRGIYLLWLNPPYDWGARESEWKNPNGMKGRSFGTASLTCVPRGYSFISFPRGDWTATSPGCSPTGSRKSASTDFPRRSLQGFQATGHFRRVERRNPKRMKPGRSILKKCGSRRQLSLIFPWTLHGSMKSPFSGQEPDFVFRSKEIDPKELDEEIQWTRPFPSARGMTTPLRMVREDQTHHAAQTRPSRPDPGLRAHERYGLGQGQKKSSSHQGDHEKRSEARCRN